MPDGSVIGTFICDEEQRPQTVNDNPTMTDVATLLEDKKLSLMCSTSGMESEEPSEGMELTFLTTRARTRTPCSVSLPHWLTARPSSRWKPRA